MASIGNLNASLTLNSANFTSGLRKASQSTKQAETQMGRSFEGMAMRARSAFKDMAAAGGVVGFGALVAKIAQVNTEYQKLQGMLFTATHSQAAAAKTMADLQKFAATTPFSLNQVTEAFVKLKNLGLNPGMAALKSYGNTASAMGKPIMQLIEAVADASTNEFERLKEFGIKSKQVGDKVQFTFQGVTTSVAKNSTDIQNYLLKIGNTQFAGSMDRQSQTLGGALSNLGDTLAQLAVKFGEAGFAPALESAIRGLTTASGSVQNFAESLGYLTGQVIGTAVSGFTLLAQNLGKVRVAIELVAAVMVGRFAQSMLASAIPAIQAFITANKAAIIGALAYAEIAPVAGTAAVALTGLRAAATGLVAALGGPLVVTVGAAALVMFELFNQSQKLDESFLALKQSINAQAQELGSLIQKQKQADLIANKLDATQRAALVSTANLTGEAGLLANAWARVAAEAKRAAIEQAKAAKAKAASNLTQAETDFHREQSATARRLSQRGSLNQQQRQDKATELVYGSDYGDAIKQARQNYMAAGRQLQELQKEKLEGFKPVTVATPRPVSTPTRGGSSSHAASTPKRDPAVDVLANLKSQGEQLARNSKDQAIWNELRSAGVSIESDMGKKIAEQTGKNFDAQMRMDGQKDLQALKDLGKGYLDNRAELGLNDRQLAHLNVERQRAIALATQEATQVNAAAAAANVAIDDYYNQKEALEKLNEQREKTKQQLEDFGRSLADIGINAFDGLITGANSFRATMKNVLKDLGHLFLEVLVYKPLEEMMSKWAAGLGGGGGGLLGIIGNAIGAGLGGAFGGGGAAVKTNTTAFAGYNFSGAFGHALGGPTQAGQAYWVGERGPEMFVPDRSGMVVPNNRLNAGGNSITIAPSYNITLSDNPRENDRSLAAIKHGQAQQNAWAREQSRKKGWTS